MLKKGFASAAVLSILAILFISAASPALAQTGTFAISGQVTLDAVPLDGANVIVNYDGHTYKGITQSNSLKAGYYEIRCDAGTNTTADVTVIYNDYTDSKRVRDIDMVKGATADFSLTSSPPGSKTYVIWGQTYVNDVLTNGIAVNTAYGGGASAVSRSDYGYDGLFQLNVTPSSGPADVTATYNGHDLTYRVDSPALARGSDKLDIRFYVSAASPTIGNVPIANTPTARPTAIASLRPSPSAPVSGAGTPTPTPITPLTSVPPTAKPPLFQTGSGEQLLLVMLALGFSTALAIRRER